ncbi:hypothetical protein VNI00_008881 [Paramarasmius palmivorus]|uniref:NACHT domain-containing protein n=1 Tax=Paramarasmius palmivorus TaxID=297713 RepID=A0AAW0CU78_9AGAR
MLHWIGPNCESGLKIVGFLASDKKLVIRTGSPSRGYVKYRTDTKKVGEDGCPVDLFVKQERHSEMLIVEVSRFHYIWPNKLLASVGISMAELSSARDIGKEMSIHRGKPYFQSLSLYVTTDSTAMSSSQDMAGKSELAAKVEEIRRTVEKQKGFIEPADAILGKLKDLSEVLVKSPHEHDEAIVQLYDNMIETHKIALEKDAINAQGHFSQLFNDIVRHSQECEMFLSTQVSQSRAGIVVDDRSSEFAKFNDIFDQLRERFYHFQTEVSTVTVLNTKKIVQSLALSNEVKGLEPSEAILPPKSLCLEGTRCESLAKILYWVFHEDQPVLWISGIAGCGKSSLIGTLQKELSTWGHHSPLAAFIRFDRSAYRNAREFIKALAFLLAKFDDRLGQKIAKVIRNSPGIVDTPNLEYQAQQLIVKPLMNSEIASEGRIVVLVDGVDECSRPDPNETDFRKQLLRLFERNIFGVLPFLRFALASRPEEDIKCLLDRAYGHIHHFPLDHTSFETKTDIVYFLTTSFQDQAFDSLEDICKSSAVEQLAERASGLFVWAATVVAFIGENVEQRLKAFIEQEPPKNALHALTALYEIALKSLVREGDEDIQQNICMALGLIMATSVQFSQFPIHVLHDLLQYVDPDKAPGILSAFNKLRSLITEENEKYQLLHKSFDDFLTSKDRAGHWYINGEKYEAILYKAMITCTMDHLDKANKELPEALSSDLYQYAIHGLPLGAGQDLFLYQSLQQKLERFLLGYVVHWLCSFDHDLSKYGDSDILRWFGEECHKQAWKLQHDSEFMQKAWLGASRLQHIDTRPLVVKDFFNIMLYNTALAGKVTKTNADDQHALEWEVDNIYMSVFVQMAGGSNVYEEIVAVLDKKLIPPVVTLSAEMEMLIKIVSGGKIRMDPESVVTGKEASTKEFIEWGVYEGGVWVPIAEPEDEDSDW